MSDKDTIYRQAAIDALMDDLSYYGARSEAPYGMSRAIGIIKKLPPAQAQSCKDAVSKADVLEAYAELYDVFDDNKEIKNELHKIYDKINALQAAQPQRIKGRWIDVTKTGGAELWKCSECGELELEDSYFCPNCGSDNRGDNDGNE